MEDGVARLLESLAAGLGGAKGAKPRRPRGDFADFVARKEGRRPSEAKAPRENPARARGPAVRVEATESESAEEEEELREAMRELERELGR